MKHGRAHELIERQRQKASPHPTIVGHRGSAGRFPENTLASFRAGIEVGAEVIELDYHHSSDGVPIVIHDPTLDRTTNAEPLWGKECLTVASRSAAELVTLDAGGYFDPFFRGELIPTLRQALECISLNSIDAAVLDVNLGSGQTSAPVADVLNERDIPYIFATGYGASALRFEDRDKLRVDKPYDAHKICETLRKCM